LEAAGETYTIRQLADEFGLTVRTIRFYEEKGLLAPTRKENGRRIYSARDRVRLGTIVQIRKMGFSVSDIPGMLAGPDGNLADLKLSLSDLDKRILSLQRQEGEVDKAIAALMRHRSRLLGEEEPPS
jgi:DNA-binding transcriptional MerR regulator